MVERSVSTRAPNIRTLEIKNHFIVMLFFLKAKSLEFVQLHVPSRLISFLLIGKQAELNYFKDFLNIKSNY